MAINSYFYDSVAGDRPYSAADFAKAFEIGFVTGIFAKNETGALGFDIGGSNFTTIYAGKAMLIGHFVEVVGTEILTVPAGSYSGQIVVQVDADDARGASIYVKQDRTPLQTSTFYELPLYNATVVNGIITSVIDVRTQGGAIPTYHTHAMNNVSGLESELATKVEWRTYGDGGYLQCGDSVSGLTYRIYLTPVQPWDGDATDRHVWIQTDL
jgi:hypothetical protein